MNALEDCAIREAIEEVGLAIAIDSLLCVTDHILPEEGQHWVSPAYLGRVLAGEVETASRRKRARCSGFGLKNFHRGSP
jgi:8-oxo-dGTP diphosphatase